MWRNKGGRVSIWRLVIASILFACVQIVILLVPVMITFFSLWCLVRALRDGFTQ